MMAKLSGTKRRTARRTVTTEPNDRSEIDLHSTTDARVWTEEFSRTFPDRRPDDGTMLAWFATAIEAGRTAGARTADQFREVVEAATDVVLQEGRHPEAVYAVVPKRALHRLREVLGL